MSRAKKVRRREAGFTALGCAKRVITELGVFDVAGDCFVCVMRAPGIDRPAIERATGARVLFTTVTSGA